MTAKIGQLIELTRALDKNDLPDQSDISRKVAEAAIRADRTDCEDVNSGIIELCSSASIPAGINIIGLENEISPTVEDTEVIDLLYSQTSYSEYIVTAISIWAES